MLYLKRMDFFRLIRLLLKEEDGWREEEEEDEPLPVA